MSSSIKIIPVEYFAAEPIFAQKVHDEEPHATRDNFDRDRDRILYSKEFRRLSGKTQVFVSGFNDDVRTRLTHTLEVAQISKSICKTLALNSVLAEAIALGHDVGHTPFGHVGERVLNNIMNGCEIIKDFNEDLPIGERGFKHNFQGVRVLTELEVMNRRFAGLNLTDFTLWGILNHSKTTYNPCELKSEEKCGIRRNANLCKIPETKNEIQFNLDFYCRYNQLFRKESWSIEALVVRIADEIAQRNHDIQDGIFANIIDPNELIDFILEKFESFLDNTEKQKLRDARNEKNITLLVMTISQIIVNFLTTQLMIEANNRLLNFAKTHQINGTTSFNDLKSSILEKDIFELIDYSKDLKKVEKEFQKFLKDRIISSYTAQKMDGKADYIIRQLFKCFVSNPQQLPDTTILKLYRYLGETISDDYSIESFPKIVGQYRGSLKDHHRTRGNKNFDSALLRIVCDHIAGMTDKYALKIYRELYESAAL